MADIREVRRTIEEAATQFFRRRLVIDERMFQVLELTEDSQGEFAPSSLGLLASALRFQPNVAAAIDSVGISISAADAPHLPLHPYVDPMEPDFCFGFEAWFRFLDEARMPPTEAFKRVRKTGRLTVIDAIQGCLEARYLDDRSGHRGEGYVSPNDLVGFLAQRIGAERIDKEAIDESRINDICQQIISCLQQTQKVDEDCGNAQFILYHDGNCFRLRPFGTWGGYQLEDSPLCDGRLWISRGNVLQPVEHFGSDRILELEELINSDAPESAFQQFFEQHPEFILALGNYKSLHPQLILHEDGGSRLIPDFFLEKLDSDFCDICDLKRPTSELARYQKSRVRFRDAVQEAVAQLTFYRDFFDDAENRVAFRSKYGLRAFRPQVVIIIGRNRSFYEEVDRIKLESGLPSWVQLKTYDDVVTKARQWRSFASSVPKRVLTRR